MSLFAVPSSFLAALIQVGKKIPKINSFPSFPPGRRQNQRTRLHARLGPCGVADRVLVRGGRPLRGGLPQIRGQHCQELRHLGCHHPGHPWVHPILRLPAGRNVHAGRPPRHHEHLPVLLLGRVPALLQLLWDQGGNKGEECAGKAKPKEMRHFYVQFLLIFWILW